MLERAAESSKQLGNPHHKKTPDGVFLFIRINKMLTVKAAVVA
ncbi:hypothetical protein [Paenibacillus bouchesdurhonensis]|nr:hypothetical protein [Paenibacillus bouchesdurhonensis]